MNSFINRLNKPVVFIYGWSIYTNSSGNFQLAGYAIDHPHLGTQFVNTSKILRIDFEEDLVETRNTIYQLGAPL